MVHDALRGGHHKVAKLTGREQARHPVLDLAGRKVKAGGDDAALVQATVELDHNLAGAAVVNKLKLANVTYEEEKKESRG